MPLHTLLKIRLNRQIEQDLQFFQICRLSRNIVLQALTDPNIAIAKRDDPKLLNFHGPVSLSDETSDAAG